MLSCMNGKGKAVKRDTVKGKKKVGVNTGLCADLYAAVEQATPEALATAYHVAVPTSGGLLVLLAPCALRTLHLSCLMLFLATGRGIPKGPTLSKIATALISADLALTTKKKIPAHFLRLGLLVRC